MKKFISIKYKFLFVLLLIPSLSSLAYYLIAKGIFEKDKLAYIYEASLQSTHSVAQKLRKDLDQLDKLSLLLKIGHEEIEGSKLVSLGRFKQVMLVNSEGKRVKSFWGEIEEPRDFKRLEEGKDRLFFLSEKHELVYQTKIWEQQYLYCVMKDDILRELIDNSALDGIVLLSQEGTILFSDQQQEENSDFKKNVQNFLSQTGRASARMVEFGNKQKYIFSYDDDTIPGIQVISFYSWEKALYPIRQLTYQSIVFFIVVASLTIVISLLMSSGLTAGIKQLFLATQQVAQQNYDWRVEVRSNDEVSVLASSFNHMSSELKRLLGELKAYNEQLEQMVEERTRELSEALRLQKSMMDSVNQGFAIVDRDGKLKSVASKSASLHLNYELEYQSNILSLLGQEVDPDALKVLLGHIFDEVLPFQDIVPLLPQMLKINRRNIFVTYFPFYNDEDKFDGLVVVTSDKTEEVLAIEQRKVEEQKSKMVLSVFSDISQFKSVLKKTHSVMDKLNSTQESSVQELFREVHTIKASLLLFNVYEAGKIFHELEDLFAGRDFLGPQQIEQLEVKKEELVHYFNEFINLYGESIGVKSLDNVDAQLSLALDRQELVQALKGLEETDQKLAFTIRKMLFSVPSSKFCDFFQRYLQGIAGRQGKLVRLVCKDDQRIYDFGLEEFKSSLIHVFSNAVNHGIETRKERVDSHKQEEGIILFQYQEQDQWQIFSIEDDGQGIDRKKVKAKLAEMGKDVDSLSDADLLLSIFEDQFSTQDGVSDVAGRGVGMAAVKEVVVRMGGEIKVLSQEGKGTQFLFRLPLV